MIEVDLNEMNYYSADSCAISHSASLFKRMTRIVYKLIGFSVVGFCKIKTKAHGLELWLVTARCITSIQLSQPLSS